MKDLLMSVDLKECKGCKSLGACCYFTIEVDGYHLRSTVPCLYLNTSTGLCKRYETRSEVSWCNPGGSPKVAWPKQVDCPHAEGSKKISILPPNNPEAVDVAVRRALKNEFATCKK